MHGFLLLLLAIYVAFGLPVFVVWTVRTIGTLLSRLRTWVVLAVLAGAVWFCWRANTDTVQQQLPEVRRAELVRLPSK